MHDTGVSCMMHTGVIFICRLVSWQLKIMFFFSLYLDIYWLYQWILVEALRI